MLRFASNQYRLVAENPCWCGQLTGEDKDRQVTLDDLGSPNEFRVFLPENDRRSTVVHLWLRTSGGTGPAQHDGVHRIQIDTGRGRAVVVARG